MIDNSSQVVVDARLGESWSDVDTCALTMVSWSIFKRKGSGSTQLYTEWRREREVNMAL